jgi:MiaB/RimO family radical SAM methylthiotransferase
VLERVKKDVAAGVREVWLTSQDMACYGLDKGSNLPELLTSVCDVQGQFKIRVGMMTPNHAKGFVSNLIDAFRNEKIFKFVHLPLQSGDDEILKRMRRFYSAEDFKETVRTFRESFPEITVETDVICGFPGESEEAFQHTMRSIAEVRPDIVNVSKFFARPKTEACRMEKDFVSPSHIKQRTGLIAQQAKKTSLERNQRWIGWTGEIIVDEVGKVKGTMVGRNFVYKPVVVTAADSVLGKTLHVRIAGAFSTYLEGEVVSSRRRTLLAPEVVDSL